MIKITKGNPTPEEIAALVAALTLSSGTTKRRITSSAAGEWRRSTPFDEVNPAALSGHGRRWRRVINLPPTRGSAFSAVGDSPWSARLLCDSSLTCRSFMIAHNVWSQAGGKTGWQLAAGSASRTVARQPAAAARKMGQAANPQPTD